MCNYFSIGIESRIGLGFDKKRTSSVFVNKMYYGWEGIKKMCFAGQTKKIRDIVDYMTTLDKETGKEKIIFASDA